MAPLNGKIAGRVVDEAGKTVAGALVAVLEAPDSTPQATKVDGAFALENLPDGALTVLAVEGRRVARLETKSGQNDAVLSLKTPQNDEATRRQIAEALLNEGAAFMELLDSAEIIGIERLERAALRADSALGPDGALLAGKGGRNLARFVHTAARLAPQRIWARHDEWMAVFNGDNKNRGQSEVVRAILAFAGKPENAPADATEARLWVGKWLEANSKELNARATDKETILQALLFAQVAAALEKPDAAKRLDFALQLMGLVPEKVRREEAENWGGVLAAISAEALPQALKEAEDDLDRFLLLCGAVERPAAPQTAAQTNAALDKMAVLAALPRVRELEKAYQAKGRDYFSLASYLSLARSSAARNLAKTDAAAALKLAQTLEEDYQKPSVLLSIAIQSAQTGNREMALQALGALEKSVRGAQFFAARAGALAAPFDKALSERFFMLAKDKAPGDDEDSSQDALYALYHAAFDPAEARLIIETEWPRRLAAAKREAANPDPDDDLPNAPDLGHLAQAMAVLDPARAVEWIAQIPEERSGTRGEARAQIAAVLLAGPEKLAFVGRD